MTEWCILFRNHNKKVGAFIHDVDDSILTWSSEEKAKDFADNNKYLQSVLYQIVELNEL